MLALTLVLHHGNGTVIITVTIVWMVQMAIHQIINVVTMRHCLVPTARPMHMIGVVAATLMIRRTVSGVLC